MQSILSRVATPDLDELHSGQEEELVLKFRGKNNFFQEIITNFTQLEVSCVGGMGRRKEGAKGNPYYS